MEPEHGAELRAALRAAQRARALVMDRYARYRADRASLRVETKADATPVTEADREVERAVEQELSAAFPDHGFFGEETGRRRSDAAAQWLVDPIDGTKSFLLGLGQFVSTQIALLRDGRLELGVSCAPMAGELAWAERGLGAWLDGRRLQVSAVTRLEDAALSFGNITSLTREPYWTRFGALLRRAHHRRGFGDWYHFHRLAEGCLDAVVESDVSILDVAALAVIVEEAGGRVTDLRGEPLTLSSTSIVATNGPLHDAVLDALNR